jgi:hypothetical protein
MSDDAQKGVPVEPVEQKVNVIVERKPPSPEEPEMEANSDLAALAMGALKVFATSSPTDSEHIKAEVTPLMNGHDGLARQPLPSMALDPGNQGMRHISPNLNITKGADELAPIQPASPTSEKSNGGFTLPSIAEKLGDLADAATGAFTANKDTLGEHRHSISSAQSPRGPPLFPASQASHHRGHGSPPISPSDGFRRELPSPGRPGPGHYNYNNPRRPSHEGPPYPVGTPYDYSSSSTETPSTDQSGSTPAGIPSGIDRMSIDNMTNPQMGGFQCSYSGCNAAPFQTQYLLNSHANVHSSNRPHYCPVKGCPRGENGKGFKRKNEMIRHGLVHESPGYVCPYCNDREHKYPRPDNLQRSVCRHIS